MQSKWKMITSIRCKCLRSEKQGVQGRCLRVKEHVAADLPLVVKKKIGGEKEGWF